ncbi:MAG TPA: tetratricopeptide repeat protein [Aggregatilineales bacterium]|nr:tetratricopeptide repeat protein [Anaerolineales bacterium]HRE49406.1 tetratricopeptide repeat protein [Aggregatilineales bacterium]
MMNPAPFTPNLTDRLSAEWFAHARTLLDRDPQHDPAALHAEMLRMTAPEPPRDGDLPLLPDKRYPRLSPAHVRLAQEMLLPPPPPAELIGRGAEMDRLAAAIGAGRLALVEGAGKTALLRQLADDSRIRRSFKRIWWLDDLRDALTRLGVALDAPNLLIAEAHEAAAPLREHLTETNTLLIVDSTEGLDNGAEWLFAVAPYVVVGRSGVAALPHLPNPIRVTLSGLPEDEAVRWLMALSRQPETIIRPLCALVEHHPNAIRLLAAMMTEDGLPPAALTAILAETPTADPAGRLAALYAASFEALPENYQALCGALSATPRRWISVEAISGRFPSPLAAGRALTFLEKRCFIERMGDQLRVIGNWADRLIRGEGWMALANTPHPSERLRAALVLADQGEPEGTAHYRKGVALTDAATDDAGAEAGLRAALAAHESAGLKYGAAQAILALGRLAYLRGDDSGAASHIESSARILYELRDDAGLEIARVALARVYRRAGRLDAALAILGIDSDPAELTAVYWAKGLWGEAISLCEQWLAEEERGINPERQAQARLALTQSLIGAGRLTEALNVIRPDSSFGGRWMRASLAHLMGDLPTALKGYAVLQSEASAEWRAIVARAQGRALAASGAVHEAALSVGAEGVWYEATLPRPAFARQRASHALHAHLTLLDGRPDDAESAARRVREISGERPDPAADALAFHVLGHVARLKEAHEAAALAFEAEATALGGVPKRDDHRIGIALHELAESQRCTGNAERAIANFRRALSHKDATRDRTGTAITALALGRLLRVTGRVHEALETFQRAVEILQPRPSADLSLLGYALLNVTALARDLNKAGGSDASFNALITVFVERFEEAVHHESWGIPCLAIRLFLHSEAPLADPVAAIDLAEHALTLAETNAPRSAVAFAARRDLGELYLRVGRPADAAEILLPLAAASPEEKSAHSLIWLAAHLTLAQAALVLDETAEALRQLEAARPYEPDLHAQGEILREAARISAEAGDPAAAAAYLSEALTHLARERDLSAYADAVVALAYTRLRLRQFPEAIDTFSEALSVVEQAPNANPTLIAAVYADKAAAHETLGQFPAAADAYRHALKRIDLRHDPERWRTLAVALGRSSAAAGDHQSAVESYFDALQIEGIPPDERRAILTVQAESFIQLGQSQAAIHAYDTAVGIEGASPLERADIHRGLGAVYTTIGAHDKARSHLKLVLEAVQDDRTGITHKTLGDGYRAQGMGSEALDAYHRALNYLRRETHPVELAAAERALGELYLERSSFANAIAHLEKALDLEKARPQQQGAVIVGILGYLAAAHERRGELAKAAVRHHEALVYLDPRHTADKHIETLCALGRLYLALKKGDDATRAFEEARKVHSLQPTPDAEQGGRIALGLGQARILQGAWEAAAMILREVAERSRTVASRNEATLILERAEGEISRHLTTLKAAEQSLTLMARTGTPDLIGTVFVRALQAQTSADLGRADDAVKFLTLFNEVLAARRAELARLDDDPTVRALRALLAAADAPEMRGEHIAAAAAALDGQPKTNPALRWVVAHLAEGGR